MAGKPIEGQLVVFNDEFVRSRTKARDPMEIEAFRFDYSPSLGRIYRIEPIQQFKAIFELSLIGHNIENISALQSMTRLVRLNLSWNSITSIAPLLKIPTLEDVTLSHNKIITIPTAISNWKRLRILRLGYNPLKDRRELVKLQPLDNLMNLDVEGSPVARDDDSLLYITFILPQVCLLNRELISLETRRSAAERFERSQIEELQQENDQYIDQINRLQAKVSELEAKLSQLDKALPVANGELDDIRRKCERLSQELEKQKQIVEQRDNELADEREANADLRAQIADMAYDGRSGPSTPMKGKGFAELQEKYDKLEAEVTNLRKSLEEAMATNTKQKAELEKLKAENKIYGEENDRLKSQIIEEAKHYQQIQLEFDKLKAEAEQNREIAERQREYIKVLEQREKNPLVSSIAPRQKLESASQVTENRIKTLENRNHRLQKINDELRDEVAQLTTKLRQCEQQNKELQSALTESNNQNQMISESAGESQLSDIISPFNEKLFEENRELKNLKITLQNKLIDMENEVRASQIQLESKAKELEAMKKQVRESESAVTEAAQLRQKVEDLARRLATTQDQQAMNQEHIRQNLKSKDTEIDDLKAKLITIAKRNQEAVGLIEANQAQVTELRTENAKLKGQISRHEEECRTIREESMAQYKEKLLEVKEKMKSLFSDLDDAKEKIEHLTSENSDLSKRCAVLSNDNETLSKEIEELRQNNLGEKERELMETTTKLRQAFEQKLTETVSNKDTAIQNLQKEVEREQNLRRDKESELERIQKILVANQNEIKVLREAETRANMSEHELEQMKSTVNQLKMALKQCMEQRERFENESKRLQSDLEQSRTKIQNLTHQNTQALSEAKAEAHNIRAELASIRMQVEKDVSNFTRNCDVLKERLQNQLSLVKARSETENRSLIGRLKAENRMLKTKSRYIESDDQSLESALGLKQQLRTQIQHNENLHVLIEQMEEAAKGKEQLSIQLKKVKRAIAAKDEIILELERVINSQEYKIKELKQKIKACKTREQEIVESKNEQLVHMTKKAKEMKVKKEGMMKSMTDTVQRLQSDIDDKNLDYEQLISECKGYKQQLKQNRASIEEGRRREELLRNEIESKTREVERLTRLIESLRGNDANRVDTEIYRLKDTLSQAKSEQHLLAEKHISEMRQKDEQIASLRRQVDKEKRDADKMERRLNEEARILKDKLEDAKSKAKQGETTIANLTKEVNSKEMAVMNKDSEIKTLQTEIAQLKAILSEKERDMSNITQKYAKLEKAGGKKSDQVRSLEQQVTAKTTEIQKLRADKETTDAKMQSQQTEIGKLKQQAERYEAEVYSLEQEKNQYLGEINELQDRCRNAVKLYEESEARVREMEGKIRGLESGLEETAALKDDVLAQTQMKISDLKETIHQQRKAKKTMKTRMRDEIELRDGQVAKLKSKAKKLKEMVQVQHNEILEHQKKISALSAELAQKNGRIEDLSNELATEKQKYVIAKTEFDSQVKGVEEMNVELKELRTQNQILRQKEAELARNKEELDKTVLELSHRLESVTKEKDDLNLQLQSRENAFNQLQSDSKKNMAETRLTHQNEIKEFTSKLTTANEMLTEYKEKSEKYETELRSTEVELARQKELLTQSLNQAESMTAVIADLKSQIIEKENQNTELSSELSQRRTDLEDCQRKITDMQGEIEMLTTAKTAFESETKLAKETNADLEKLNAQLSQQNNELQESVKTLTSGHEACQKDLESTKEKLAQTEADLQHTNELLTQMTAENEKMSISLADEETKVQLLTSENERLKEDIQKLKKNVKMVKSELASTRAAVTETNGKNEREKQELRATIDNLKQSIQESQTRIQTMNESMCPVQDLKDVNHRLRAKDRQLADAVVQLKRLKGVNSEYKEKLGKLQKQAQNATEALNTESERSAQLSREVEKLKAIKTEQKNEILKLKDSVTRKEREKVDLEIEKDEVIKELESKSHEMEEENKKLMAQCQDLVASNDSKTQELNDLRAQVNSCEDKNKDISIELDRLKNIVQEKQNEQLELKKQLEKQQIENEQLTQQLTQQQTERNAADKNLQEMQANTNTLEAKYNELQKKESENQQIISALRAQNESLVTQNSATEANCSRLRRAVSKIEKYKSVYSQSIAQATQMKETLARQLQQIGEKDLEIERKAQENARIQKDYDHAARLVKKQKMKLTDMEQRLKMSVAGTAQQEQVRKVASDIHTFLQTSLINIKYPRRFIAKLIQHLISLFEALSMPLPNTTPKYAEAYQMVTKSVALIDGQGSGINESLEALRRELMTLPMNQPVKGTANTPSERVAQLIQITKMIQRAVAEKSREFDNLTKTIASQHAVVMNLTRTNAEA